MIGYLLLVVAISVLASFLFIGRHRRRVAGEGEKEQQLSRRRQEIEEFLQDLSAARPEGGDRNELFRRIARAALRCAGGLTACVLEPDESGKLEPLVVEGLFPPQFQVKNDSEPRSSSRASLIEEVLRPPCLDMGSGVIGSVAASKLGELIVDCSQDERVYRHTDPALRLRTMIVSPILAGNELIAVMAVANSVGGDPFSKDDFQLVRSLATQVGPAIRSG